MCTAIWDGYVLSFCSSTIQVVTDRNNEAKYFPRRAQENSRRVQEAPRGRLRKSPEESRRAQESPVDARARSDSTYSLGVWWLEPRLTVSDVHWRRGILL